MHSITFELFLKLDRRRLCRRGASALAEDYLHALPTLFSRGSLGFDPRMIRPPGSAGGGGNFLQLIVDTCWIYIHSCGHRRFGSKPRASTELAVCAPLCHGPYFGAFGPGAHGRVILPDPDDTS